MLGSPVLDAKPQDNDDKNGIDACNSKHNLIKDWTSSEEKKFFLKRRFGSPRMLSKSIPRRNRSLFRYKMNRSLNLDNTNSRKINNRQSPNPSPGDNSFELNKSSRDLSRSAKIMRALSYNRDLFYHRNANIKKSLTFESTPSPQKHSSSSLDESTHTDSKISTSSPTLDKFLRLSATSTDSSPSSLLITSSESIDENQNQTPQQNRKLFKVSRTPGSNGKEDTEMSEGSSSTSLLRSGLKERIDNIVNSARTPGLRSLKQNNRVPGYDIVASTPRNLFEEFDQNESSRPCTPENMICIIPESISDIKKSHKKERLYNGEQPFIRQMNAFVENEKPHGKSTIESLKIDDASTSGSYEASSSNQCQKKTTKVKKTLVYDSDDELSDSGSIPNYVAMRKIPGDIDSSDCGIYDENVQNIDSTSPSLLRHSDKEEDRSGENICNIVECRPSLQKESSSNINIAEQGNRTISFESNPSTSRDFNAAVTPENRINILQSILTESIKKSHKKIKHENSKALFKSKLLRDSKLEISFQNIHDSNDNLCEDLENKSIDTTCNSQNPDRPSTPKTVNSSRLLLSQYSSIKKSHRKDKRDVNKRTLNLAKCYEYCKKNVSSLPSSKYEEESTSDISLKNESFQPQRSSPDVSPNKKKKSIDVSLQDSMQKSSDSSISLSLGSENTSDEFKIYTPIRRRMPSILHDYVYVDETSLKKDEATQAVSKKINFSRCMTPVACHSHSSTVESRKNESLTYDRCVNAENLIDNARNMILSDNKSADPAHLTGGNGRSTPINMSTTELLCNIDSIKKSHKKDKHDHLIHKRQNLGKEQSYTKKNRNNMNSTSNINTLKENTTPFLKLTLDVNSPCAKVAACSNTTNDDESYEIIVGNNSQPSTSRGNDSTEDKSVRKSKLLNTTPPNCLNTSNFIKLLQTTSIKKSHKKERDRNAQAKYILMSKQHDESDDGSIFDEEDRLTSVESFGLCQDNGNEKIHKLS